MSTLDKDKTHEVGGLQETVSTLESASENIGLTLTEIERNHHNEVNGVNQIQSRSFKVFYNEVKPTLYKELLTICLDLDSYLVANHNSNYQLEFNLEKYPTSIIYGKLKNLRQCCFSETLPNWYFKFIVDCSNLDSVEAIRKGFARC